MPKTQVSCPNCRQPVVVEIEQLFNLDEDPSAKQKLLSGAANLLQCPHCGFQGPYSAPIVYHDSKKELLLTFVPPELGLSLDQQERTVGPLINKVVNSLPQEKRKAYLLRPKAMLQLQTLIETILEADGITKEMVKAQQDKLSLLQRLVNTTSDEVFKSIVEEEEKLIDQQFFSLINTLVQNSLASGDNQLAQRLTQVQEELLPITEVGRNIKAEANELEFAIQELQEKGETLTRESLLDMVANVPNDARLRAYVNLARPGMDYEFFQLLSGRIDRARGEGRHRLAKIREQLLELTQQYDQQIDARVGQIHQLINALVQEEHTKEATLQVLPAIDSLFLQVIQNELETARRAGDLSRSGKLREILDAIQEASQAPPELEFVEELLAVTDKIARQKILQENSEKVTQNLIDILTSLVGQMEGQGNQEGLEQINEVYQQVIRFSMQNQFSQ